MVATAPRCVNELGLTARSSKLAALELDSPHAGPVCLQDGELSGRSFVDPLVDEAWGLVPPLGEAGLQPPGGRSWPVRGGLRRHPVRRSVGTRHRPVWVVEDVEECPSLSGWTGGLLSDDRRRPGLDRPARGPGPEGEVLDLGRSTRASSLPSWVFEIGVRRLRPPPGGLGAVPRGGAAPGADRGRRRPGLPTTWHVRLGSPLGGPVPSLQGSLQPEVRRAREEAVVAVVNNSHQPSAVSHQPRVERLLRRRNTLTRSRSSGNGKRETGNGGSPWAP